MSRKKVSKATKRRLYTFGMIAFFLIGYFIFNLISYTVSIVKLKNEEKKLGSNLILLKENEVDLKNEITKLNDPEYIAKYARENYHYSKDGEYIIQMNKTENENEKEESKKLDIKPIIVISIPIMIIAVVIFKKTI